MTKITEEQAKAAYQAFVKELNLSDEQKEQFRTAVDNAIVKLNDMAAKGETLDGPTAKQAIRSAVENWLTPEQLGVWDRGWDKVRAALGL